MIGSSSAIILGVLRLLSAWGKNTKSGKKKRKSMGGQVINGERMKKKRAHRTTSPDSAVTNVDRNVISSLRYTFLHVGTRQADKQETNEGEGRKAVGGRRTLRAMGWAIFAQTGGQE
jgi:hypothetical protein